MCPIQFEYYMNGLTFVVVSFGVPCVVMCECLIHDFGRSLQ